MPEQVENNSPRVSKPLLKFLIGFVGGLCAAIFPRLMAALTLYGSNDIVLISAGYLGIAVIFAALVGAVVMIMEWGVLKEPRATFMTALGIPALLAGAMNTTNGAVVLDTQAKESIQLVNELSGIGVIAETGFTPLTDAGAAIGGIEPLASLVIGVAYASDGGAEQTGLDLNPSMQIQNKYVVVLESAADADDAKQKAEDLKSDVPGAQAVKAGNRFLVIDSQTQSRSDATLKAFKLKNELHLNPQLLRVK